MNYSITPLYALPVAAIYLILWVRVSALRSSTGVSFGDGDNTALLQRIRQHGNCAEWMSLVLILMIIAEGTGVSASHLHISGALLLVGRAAHPIGLKANNAGHPLRYVGNGTNFLAAFNAMIWIGLNILTQ
jgi:uncharacterized protein